MKKLLLLGNLLFVFQICLPAQILDNLITKNYQPSSVKYLVSSLGCAAIAGTILNVAMLERGAQPYEILLGDLIVAAFYVGAGYKKKAIFDKRPTTSGCEHLQAMVSSVALCMVGIKPLTVYCYGDPYIGESTTQCPCWTGAAVMTTFAVAGACFRTFVEKNNFDRAHLEELFSSDSSEDDQLRLLFPDTGNNQEVMYLPGNIVEPCLVVISGDNNV